MSPLCILLLATSIAIPEEEVRAALRHDAMSVALGVLFVALGLGAVMVFRGRARGGDPTLLWFGLFALLFGVRLLVLADTVRFAAGVAPSERLWFYVAAAITYIIPLPALLFLQEIFPQWRCVLRLLLRFQVVFAGAGLLSDQVVARPESLRIVNSTIVLLAFVALIAALFRQSGAHTSVQALRIGVLTFSGTIVLRNLSALEILPLRVDLEPLGFAVFLAALARVVAARAAEREQAVAVLNAKRQAAEHASKAKTMILANISHELRTPLNAILGYAEMLRENAEAAGDLATVADLNRIESASRHLLALSNSVLDISKIEAGKVDVELETIEVRPLVEDVLALVEPIIRNNENEFICDVQPGLGRIIVDRVKLQQILVNLLSNAGKFTRRGTVTLSVRQERRAEGDRITFEVRDTGVGMTEQQLERVFRPFEQATPQTARQYGGTGLGLTVSRKLCELMKGWISVVSAQGCGSTFSVTFPVDPRPHAPVSAATADVRATAPLG